MGIGFVFYEDALFFVVLISGCCDVIFTVVAALFFYSLEYQQTDNCHHKNNCNRTAKLLSLLNESAKALLKEEKFDQAISVFREIEDYEDSAEMITEAQYLIQNLRGFFQWKNGRIEKLKGYYIYDDVGKPIKIEQTKVKKEEPAPAKTSKVASVLIALLCAATLFLSCFAISLNNKYEKQLEKQEEILADISNQQEEIKTQKDEIEGQKTEIGKQNEVIQNQADAIAKLQELLANGVLDSTGQTTAADLLAMLENHELTLQNQDELIAELKALLEKKPEEGIVTFKAYTVVAGDSLSKICAENNLDYGANYKIILAINGIKDANQIYVGQTILLPFAD